MRNSMDSGFNEIKDVKGRRGIRDRSEETNFLGMPDRMKLSKNEDRSNSEPPRSFGSYLTPANVSRLKPIREKNQEDAQGSSDEDELSNSQLNESDLDLEIPDSASASVSQTPTPTPLASSHARRINSETNLNDSKRRLSGFMGNRSKRFCASTSELSFSSHLDTQKSLFSAKNNALSRQSFNSSLYGSNMSLSSTNSRLFMVNSPFYSGKTMFGGASAYPKRDINQHKILRTPVQMRPSSSLSNSSNTSAKSDNVVPESNAAKRILEVMNQFSGPIKEARTMGNNINSILKIPSLVQDRKRFGEEDRNIALNTAATPYSRPITSKRPESPLLHAPITKQLQIPTMSQLLQMKRLQSNTEKVREIANRSDSFLNRNHEYKLPSSGGNESQNNSSSLKMKSNITKNLLRSDKTNSDMPALPVNLPNIQLPELRSIPKFDIQLPPPVSSVSSSEHVKSSAPVKTVTKIVSTPPVQFNFQAKPAQKAMTNNLKSDFVLSKPLPLEMKSDLTGLKSVSDKFVFSKPLLINEKETEAPNHVLVKSPVKSSLSTPATDNLFANLVAQQKSASWECDSCLTRNDSEKTQCLCCSTSKKDIGNAKKVLSSTPSCPPADNLFKSLAAQQKSTQWECDGCFTKNDANKEKCPCCDTPKPGSKVAPAVSAQSSFSFGMPAKATSVNDDLFKTLAAKQKSQWECDACMVRNDIGRETCLSCDTPKPGSNKTATTAPSSVNLSTKSSFSFGMPTATSTQVSDEGFKKIVAKQSASWECSTCMTRNESSKTKCVCCEQEKPGSSSSAPQFSFGSKLTSTVSLPAPSEVKFQFGMPKADPVATPVEVSVPKVEPAPPAIVESKKDEVDKPKSTFSFGVSSTVPATTANASVPSFTFKTPSPSVSTSFSVKPTVEEKKEENEKPTGFFSFGAANSSPMTTLEPKKVEEVKPVEEPVKNNMGGFKFGGAESAIVPTTTAASLGNALNKNGGFSFGGFGAKPVETTTEATKSAFSFTAPTNKPMIFGAPAPTSVEPTIPASTSNSSFVFGGSKAEKEVPKAFESTPSFGVPSIQSAPVFGQSNAFSFSANKEPSAPALQPTQSSIFAFGAKPEIPAASPGSMLFGSPSTNPAQATKTFGAGFGSTTNNNNNEFGSKMPSFSNQPQKRAFEFSSAAPEVSQNKKFDFGSQQNQPQPNASPFQFNTQAAEVKPAFNFTPSAPASFNFSGATQNNPQAPTSAPVMQFGGLGAPVANQLMFSAQGTGSAAANQRKILRAARRTTRR